MGALESWLSDLFAKAKLDTSNLHQYQRDAEQFMYRNPFSALFLDTGLGKTAACIRLIHRLIMNEEAKRVLVIGPSRVAHVTWPDELRDWWFGCPLSYNIIRDDELPKRITKAGQAARKVAKLSGHGEDVVKAMVAEARHKEAQVAVRDQFRENPACVHLINQEQCEFLVEAWGRDWPYDVVIIDESSSLKDHKTNRWKALWKIRPLLKRMHQLTATPASETYLHLFAQITLLDQGQRFGRSFTKFAERFFTFNKWSMKWSLRPGAEEEITNLMSDICIVMKQEDYLELQQPNMVFHPVRLSPKQLEIYQEMESEFVITLPGGEQVEAETASALSQKLLQMASGVLYDTVEVPPADPDGDITFKRVVHPLHDHKIDALRQLREELNGENILVAYHHKSSLDRLLKAFPDAKVMDKAGTLIKEWNAGKIPMFLIHPQSDAHGLNLQHGGRHVCFFDIPWSYERYYQLYRRLARQGQKLLVIVHHLVAVGTKDEMVAECLKNKKDAQEVLFAWITKIRREMRKRKEMASDEL